MKFPVSMLRDFVETSLSATELGDLLTMAGFELEGIDEVEGEPVLDIRVVSNRGDGLSVQGLAREVLAKDASATPTDLYARAGNRYPRPDAGGAEAQGMAQVSIETAACTRYACRLFRNGRNGEAPDWIRDRLRRAGQRPISLLVDLTNYVMLELGQPVHAFDFDTLRGGRIVVREARAGETLTTLNGEEHELRPGQMMICDEERPVAAAGIMGGLETEVSNRTKTVLLESAHFECTSVRRTRKQLGLSTEASYRFERSVDPEGVPAALNRFAELLEGADAGWEIVPGIVEVFPAPPPPRTLDLRMSRVERLLGMPVGARVAKQALEALGFAIEGDGEPFAVRVPSWRFDVVREDDLVEEVGRVYGYDKIPEQPLQGTTVQGGVFGFERYVDRVRAALLRCGFTQTIHHSLGAKHPLDYPGSERFGPRNPHSPEAALLRNSLLPGLAETAARNGGRDLHLFEIGATFGNFLPDAAYAHDATELAFLSTGALQPAHWKGQPSAEADFFSAKAVLEEVFRIGDGVDGFGPRRAVASASADPRLHPTQQAVFRVDDVKVALVGRIHPDLADAVGLSDATVVAEVDLYTLWAHPGAPSKFHAISRNPAVRRDLSIMIPKATPYARLEAAIREACGEPLERVWLFDQYTGKGIPDDAHSLSIALQLRKAGENFTDEEANQVRDRAVKALEALGATLR
ncbi:MAG: phenylalanine--tRNA ligase subunit beta [Chthonomonadaceae bacterium]|nr:phenylalanine--tRNA ligase subunit beta [Chthonomonadaceae bacterium]